MSAAIKPVLHQEAEIVAQVLRASYRAAYPNFEPLHTPQEDLDFVRSHLLQNFTVLGAYQEGSLCGFVAFTEGDLDQLYVKPGCQGEGIGSALLGMAQERTRVLELWTYAQNQNARQFYEKRGFYQIDATDGDNEERQPDIKYRWEAQ